MIVLFCVGVVWLFVCSCFAVVFDCYVFCVFVCLVLYVYVLLVLSG